MSSKSLENATGCPCNNNCKTKRTIAVNLVLQNEICSASDLRDLLLNGELGKYATRRSLEFLSEDKCALIGVFLSLTDQKPLQFGRRGRLFYTKTVTPEKLNETIRSLLTPLQRRILEKFTKLNRRIYYFSAYDLRRMIPSSGNEVEYAVERLTKLGLLCKVVLGKADFYAQPVRIPQLMNEAQTAIIDDKTEYAVVKRLHELIMNLYPTNVITGFEDRIRPHTQDILTITGGMAFDIFYQFFDPIAGKSYLAIDVYTRIPVNGYMVHSFIKKIEWAKTRTRKETTNYLKDKTFGMIVYRNASPNAIAVANRKGIRFLRLSDVKIDYKKLRDEVEKKPEP